MVQLTDLSSVHQQGHVYQFQTEFKYIRATKISF